MQAIVQNQPGDAQTLVLGERPIPQVGAGQLLVRVYAAGVNRADIVQREGRYPPPPGAPDILGLEVAGVVVALGEGVTAFAVGDAVLGLVAGGGYAEYALLDEALAIRKPDTMSWGIAASLPEAWMTAWFNLVEIGQLSTGQSVLIHAGASGVGSAAIQLAVMRGARTMVTAGSEDKCAYCLDLGAALAIHYPTQPAFDRIVKAEGGVDLILDCIGAPYLARNLSCLRMDGLLLVIGIMGGREAELDMGALLMKRLRVQGSTLRVQPLAVKAILAAALREQILPQLASGKLKSTISGYFDWHDVRKAHQHLEANQNIGKVVLRMGVAAHA